MNVKDKFKELGIDVVIRAVVDKTAGHVEGCFWYEHATNKNGVKMWEVFITVKDKTIMLKADSNYYSDVYNGVYNEYMLIDLCNTFKINRWSN